MLKEVLPPEYLSEQQLRDVIGDKPMKREAFTIYEVDNGFMGQVGNGIVVGTTMSEVCAAALAQYTQNKVLQDAEEQPQMAAHEVPKWQKFFSK